jgi:GNAT superfamily N-acetyltransferase
MKIREMEPSDSKRIEELLDQLGYPNTDGFIENRISQLLKNPDEKAIVAIDQEKVVAFMSIHFIPQIALKGDFARISYFVVDEEYRNAGAGKRLEEYCEDIARSRNCDRIEVHCHSRRERAHKFYYRHGYVESPKYLIKPLI